MHAIIESSLLQDRPNTYEIDSLVHQLVSDDNQIDHVLQAMRGEREATTTTTTATTTATATTTTTTKAAKTTQSANTDESLSTEQNMQRAMAMDLRNKLRGNADISRLITSATNDLNISSDDSNTDVHNLLKKRQQTTLNSSIGSATSIIDETNNITIEAIDPVANLQTIPGRSKTVEKKQQRAFGRKME